MFDLEKSFLTSTIIYCFLAAGIFYYICRGSVYRSRITYFALLEALLAAINYALSFTLEILIGAEGRYKTYILETVLSILFITFTSLAYVPGLIGFHRISKHTGSKVGVCMSILGYLWALALVLIALVVYLIVGEYEYNLVLVLDYGHCGHTFLVALLYLMTQRHLRGKTKGSLAAYILLFIVYEIFFFATNYVITSELLYCILRIIFKDFALAVALMVSVIYGYLWTSNSDSSTGEVYDKVEICSHEDKFLV